MQPLPLTLISCLRYGICMPACQITTISTMRGAGVQPHHQGAHSQKNNIPIAPLPLLPHTLASVFTVILLDAARMGRTAWVAMGATVAPCRKREVSAATGSTQLERPVCQAGRWNKIGHHHSKCVVRTLPKKTGTTGSLKSRHPFTVLQTPGMLNAPWAQQRACW